MWRKEQHCAVTCQHLPVATRHVSVGPRAPISGIRSDSSNQSLATLTTNDLTMGHKQTAETAGKCRSAVSYRWLTEILVRAKSFWERQNKRRNQMLTKITDPDDTTWKVLLMERTGGEWTRDGHTRSLDGAVGRWQMTAVRQGRGTAAGRTHYRHTPHLRQVRFQTTVVTRK